MKEQFHLAVMMVNKFKNDIASKGKIIKNFEPFAEYINLPKLEVSEDFENLSSDLEQFLSHGKVQFIPYQKADLTKVMTRYF